MPCLPGHRPTRVRPEIVLPEVAALVLVLSFLILSNASLLLSLVGAILVLLHTTLFYRLGRISERARSQPSPGFVRDLGQRLTGGRD